jgi:aminocarboxymuconate-semialdehyde decarboxylase
VLFASDCPFDKEKGPGYIRSTIAVLESIEMTPQTREKISYKNAKALFGLN